MKWIDFNDQYPPNERSILLKVHPVGLYEVGQMIRDDDDNWPRLWINCGKETEEQALIGGNGGFTHWALIEG